MSAVECVVFDIGNVLVRWDPRNLYRRMGYSDVDTAAILTETGLLEINHRQLDAGMMPFDKAIPDLVERYPAHAQFLEAFHSRWDELLGGAIEANVAVKAALRRAGIPVHAISNFSREKFDVTRTIHPFLDHFDELVISGDIGLVKPDREIFDYLIDRRGLDVSRTVFIDDSEPNIISARRLGFETIHFAEGRTDLAGELVALGLRPDVLK